MMLPRIPREIQIKVYDFVKDYIEYLKQYGDNFTCNIWTMDDDEAFRDNCGWYQYDDKEHIINMNAFNLSMTSVFIQKGILDFDSFFAFITLCTGHEYRHYIQGTVNYDGKKVEGFTEKDCLANELMLYIRYFYDGYYLTNKSNVKYELDAERFGVKEALKYLEKIKSDIDAKAAIFKAVKFSTDVICKDMCSTLPVGAVDYDDVLKKLNENILVNGSVDDLKESLFLYNPKFLQSHIDFTLHEDKVLTQDLIDEYAALTDGFERDKLVVKRILDCLDNREASLEQFPNLRKALVEHRL